MRLNELQIHQLIKGMAHCLNGLQHFFTPILPSQYLTWEPILLSCYCLFYFFKQTQKWVLVDKTKTKKNPATKAAKTKWGILQGKAGVHGLKLKNSKKTHTLRCNHHPQWVSQFSHGKDCDWGTIWEAVAFWKRYELGVSRIRSKFLVGSWEQHLAFLGFHFLNGNMMTKMIPINRDVRMMKATWDRKTLYEI